MPSRPSWQACPSCAARKRRCRTAKSGRSSCPRRPGWTWTSCARPACSRPADARRSAFRGADVSPVRRPRPVSFHLPTCRAPTRARRSRDRSPAEPANPNGGAAPRHRRRAATARRLPQKGEKPHPYRTPPNVILRSARRTSHNDSDPLSICLAVALQRRRASNSSDPKTPAGPPAAPFGDAAYPPLRSICGRRDAMGIHVCQERMFRNFYSGPSATRHCDAQPV